MLLSFRAANHRSLRDEQHLNLAPVYDADRPKGTKWPAVPVAAIYGANASGKSNVIDAFAYMRNMVLHSDRMAEPGQGVEREPFALDMETAVTPSDFDVDIEIDGVHYAYGFSIDDTSVVEEWLHRYPAKRRQIVFSRDGQNYRFGTTVEQDLREATGITPSNALFLSAAARAGKVDVSPVYQWMRGSKVDERDSFPLVHTMIGLNRYVEQSDLARSTMLSLLQSADFGITDLEVLSGPVERGVFFRMRGASGRRLSFYEQSQGTHEFIRQILKVLPVLKVGSLLVVDELESRLHPNLAEQLIRLFQDPQTNPLGAQLVFTTHNTALLASNTEVLKRDQVWFTEKGHEDGATSLFPLSEFTPRDTENTERRYRGGSYGAVPFIDDSLQSTVRSLMRPYIDPAEAPRG